MRSVNFSESISQSDLRLICYSWGRWPKKMGSSVRDWKVGRLRGLDEDEALELERKFVVTY